MKIGYAILAHDHPLNVARLAERLLETNGFVSIHFDLKKGNGPIEEIRAALGRRADEVIWAKRVSVSWGEWSMIEATFSAVTALFETGQELDYIHLMSGADYPIRPISDFEAFLGRHRGTDFTESYGIQDRSWIRDGLTKERYDYRHFFNYKRHPKLFGLNWKVQRALGLRRSLHADFTPHFGSQWCTLTTKSWKSIMDIARRPDIRKVFRWSWIPDEMFIQTLLATTDAPNSNRHLTLYQFTDYGVPVVYCNGHAAHLARQPFFFARKISPFASKLRDEIDRVLGGEVPVPRFKDHEIGRPTADYQSYRLRNRFGTDGKRIPGYSKDPWYGDLEWNRKPYVVFMGTSDEELDFIAAEIDRLPGIAGHGRLFANDIIRFSGARQRLAGYGQHDTALRDHKPTNFLSDVIHALPDELCTFALTWNDDAKLADVFRYDRRSRVVLVKGNAMRAFLESDAGRHRELSNTGAASSPLLLDEQANDFEAFCWKQEEYYGKQAEKFETAKTRFVEIDLYDVGWRRKLVEFIADVTSKRKDETHKALRRFSATISAPALSDLSASLPNAFALSQLAPGSPTHARQVAQMLARIGSPYLVLAGASQMELEVLAQTLNAAGGFILHGSLFAPGRIGFAGSAESWGNYGASETARRDADPIGFLVSVIGSGNDKVQGFCLDGLGPSRVFDYLVHDPQARILVVKGSVLRAIAEEEEKMAGETLPAPRWQDPQLFEAAFNTYRCHNEAMLSAMAGASAIMATIDLEKPDWPTSLCEFLPSASSTLADEDIAKLQKQIAPAMKRLNTMKDSASLFTNARYLNSRVAVLKAQAANASGALAMGHAETPQRTTRSRPERENPPPENT